MATIELTQHNFQETIEKNDMVIIDFWAAWCGPCRSFAPVFEEASNKYDDIVFGKVNTEAERTLASSFQVRSIPTLAIIREQVVLFAQPGALPASALDELIDQARAVNMADVHQQVAAQQDQQIKT
ncbi:MAG: thioredoxin [Gammaproteobacteria bacterium]|jgi:thioredoxin